MEVDLVNIDVEYSFLDDSNQKHREALNQEFNYLYFWLGDPERNFLANQNYSDQYLNYISQFISKLPSFKSMASEPVAWWGKTDSLRKQLGSKTFACELGEKFNCHPNGIRSLYYEEDLNDYLQTRDDQNFFIREEFSLSGIGHQRLSREALEQVKLNYPVVISPLFKRVQDFSTIVLESGEILSQQNIVSDVGQFKGVWINKCKESFLEDLMPVIEHIKELEEGMTFQIDSFTYLEGESLKRYPLVEINCRKSLGLMGNRLKGIVQKNNVATWLLLKRNKFRFNELLELVNKLDLMGEGIVITNPCEGMFCHILFESHSEHALNSLIQRFTKEFYKNSEIPSWLRSEFLKDF